MHYDLYINGSLVDINDESLIVLTYTMEQLNNPTAVKNTYSHEVTLPSTSRNDILFSHFYRNDYKVGVANFSPLQRVPFEIYNEMSEIVEGGYIKLDEVSLDRVSHTYKVTLYGGLGSFFYAMGYDEQGEALSLGDLQYMANVAHENLLNFRASADVVSNAWLLMQSREQYKVLNFAPMYNGKPSGEFDAETAIYLAQRRSYFGDDTTSIVNPVAGLPTDVSQMQPTNLYNINDGGVQPMVYATKVKLDSARTEWEMKDLRAYLQRPVLSVRKFVEAVQRRATAYGYTLNLDSAFFNDNNPYYQDAWLTLPSLQSLAKDSTEAQVALSASLTISSNSTQTQDISYTLPNIQGYDYGKEFKNVKIQIPEVAIQLNEEVMPRIYRSVSLQGQSRGRWAYIAWFLQAYIEDANGNIVGVSNVAVLNNTPQQSASDIAISAEYTPYMVGNNAPEYNSFDATFYKASDGICKATRNIELAIPSAPNAERVVLRVEKRTYNNTPSQQPTNVVFPDVFDQDYADDYFAFSGVANSVYGTADLSAYETIRSGVVVNKADLFDIGKTPLEVLLSYCKLFGLVWLYEPNSKVVTLMPRNQFYSGDNIDIEERIDRSKEMTIKPFEFDKRFYDFELETQGEWAEQYADKYGKPYGAQRVNTGYNFDRDAKNLLEGNALRGGAEVLEQSKYYCNITEDGKVCPSVFIGGAEFTQYGAEDNEEVAVTAPTRNATIEYFNDLYGYDYFSKLQMHKADNSPIDTGGTLLLYKGSINPVGTPYERFRLSDDIPDMALLNDGKLCWILEGSWTTSLGISRMPHFVRVNGVSLDMGVPQELDNPDADTEEVQNSIYTQYWRRYLQDRYSVDSRVCECYVDLRGLQVGNRLFRNFYYFDNAVWALNKISNYSMNTIGSTLCEFVKIQDISNYLEE